jgi:hypothetical protein
VASVECGDLRLAQGLAGRDLRRVDDPEPKIAVVAFELGCSKELALVGRVEPVVAGVDVADECMPDVSVATSSQDVVDLGKRQRREHRGFLNVVRTRAQTSRSRSSSSLAAKTSHRPASWSTSSPPTT